MSRANRAVTKSWPFALAWLKSDIVPEKKYARQFEEYIAGVAMLQVNEERLQASLPPFLFATVT